MRRHIVTRLGIGVVALALIALRQRRARPVIKSNEAVVTYHPEATEAGLAVLGAGGNAFDAFIAATMAEYVVAEGGTSLAGPLGVLIYDARRRNIQYLDAEFNEGGNKRGRWKAGDDPGKAMLVPGAPAGLEALSRRYGRLTFAQCLAPAIRLARQGFTLNDLYCRYIELCTGKLRSTAYGRSTFFRDGLALEPGDILRQPELASLLEKLAKRGASYMYKGGWGSRFVKAARSAGSLITMDDMAKYGAAWCEPWQATYRGYKLYSCSGRTFGGLWTMLCLKALEYTDLHSLGHWSQSADALEILVRTVRQVWEEFWLLDYRLLEDRELVNARLTSKYGARIWKRVQERTPKTVRATAGSHSYHIIVLDKDGNLASGTNTHESLAWGAGIFVDGVPLPASGYLPWGTRAGERRISPFSMILGCQDDMVRFATGSFSSSILEASLQFIINLIDYQFSAGQAATLPRLGTYPHNPIDYLSPAAADARKDSVKHASNWLDARIPAAVVSVLERRGLSFVPDSAWRLREAQRYEELGARGLPGGLAEVDTGLGALLTISPDGCAEGAIAPWPGASPRADTRLAVNEERESVNTRAESDRG